MCSTTHNKWYLCIDYSTDPTGQPIGVCCAANREGCLTTAGPACCAEGDHCESFAPFGTIGGICCGSGNRRA